MATESSVGNTSVQIQRSGGSVTVQGSAHTFDEDGRPMRMFNRTMVGGIHANTMEVVGLTDEEIEAAEKLLKKVEAACMKEYGIK